ncbi:uncharacterized protein LOC127246542 [Andrographis paniculata]|uniref:uncharacterized protein LOC127246542 n=1 Tax=Andrographis paniculata TaxID=175694 RepID=UPI0021E7491A|nr:uncharacterized protein LOC127246542 [Andrographis paniculata]
MDNPDVLLASSHSKAEKIHFLWFLELQHFSSMAAALAAKLKALFMLLAGVLFAACVYTGITNGVVVWKEFRSLWPMVILIDIFAIILPLVAWIFYKESNRIYSITWIILILIFGSMAFFPYLVLQLQKLSSQESRQDPIYFVLLNNMRGESKGTLSVVSARVLFGALGCFMLGTLIYAVVTDGSPFSREVFTPWVSVVFLDAHLLLIGLSIWVAYKEPTWMSAAFWIAFLICFQSIGVCTYITLQLLQLSPEDRAFVVLFSSSNSRSGNGYEDILILLMAASLARGLKVAFVVMSCVSNAVLIHLIATQGLLFLPEFHTMWAMSFLFDFNVLLIPIVIWIIYKESNWKNTIMWAFPILMIGSSTFCPYIVVKLMELSPQESEDDPIYFVLLTKKKRDERESRSILPVIIARFYFGYMAGYMVILWTYTIAVDGFPLRRDVFTPFALATFIDIHFLLITFSCLFIYGYLICVTIVAVITLATVKVNTLQNQKDLTKFLSLFQFQFQFQFQIVLPVSMAAALAVGLKVAFTMLACIVIAVLIYVVVTDGANLLNEFRTPWPVAFLIDFFLLNLPIAIWIIYKESNWIHSIIWIVLLMLFGSGALFPYIVLKLMKLSPQESAHDPIYFVLLTNNKQKRGERESNSMLSVVGARVLFGILACFMLATWIYTIIVDGFPFRSDVFTPWIVTTVLDIHFISIAISVWVAYKEPTWIVAAFWIILLMCFQSIGTYLYILRQLVKLPRCEPVSRLLFNRTSNGCEEALLG